MGLISDHIDIPLDIGQMWTFAILISIGIFLFMKLLFRSNALEVYLTACFIAASLTAISHFGFKADWPRHYYEKYVD